MSVFVLLFLGFSLQNVFDVPYDHKYPSLYSSLKIKLHDIAQPLRLKLLYFCSTELTR